MLTAIVDNPNSYYPKFPRVIEEETPELLHRAIRRCVSGLLAAHGADGAAQTTVHMVTETTDVTGRYVLAVEA
ncbi:hypothetical protein [Kitasatospora sp. NPDC050543]|uniref:hypothetical protein n=1 Tax=Kitasatospora sp. NPDC050543 TaxID=3364054 RepID=UPI0037AAF4D7